MALNWSSNLAVFSYIDETVLVVLKITAMSQWLKDYYVNKDINHSRPLYISLKHWAVVIISLKPFLIWLPEGLYMYQYLKKEEEKKGHVSLLDGFGYDFDYF